MIGIEYYIKLYEIFALEYTVTQFLWKKLKCWRYRKYIFPFDLFSASQRRQKWNSVKSVMSYRKCITYCVFPVSKYVIQNMSAKESTLKDLDSVYLKVIVFRLFFIIFTVSSLYFLRIYRSALHLTRSPANMLDAFLACGQTL